MKDDLGYRYLEDYNRKRLALILGKTRIEAKRSQEYMALEMGVSRKTIQNWENGVTSPTFEQVIGWFQVVNICALPYLLEYVFPDMEGISSSDEDKKIRDSLIKIIENLPMEGVRQLMYLFYGDHGSSSRAMMNLVTAYLQTPLRDRVTQANLIVKNYELEKRMGCLSGERHVKPNMEFLTEAIRRGEEAVVNNNMTYMMTNSAREDVENEDDIRNEENSENKEDNVDIFKNAMI